MEIAADEGGDVDGGDVGYEGEAWTASDDAMIIPEEGAEPISWAEYRAASVPKSELTKMRQQDSEQLNQYRQQLAAQYQQAYAQQVQQLQAQRQQGQPAQASAQDAVAQILAGADERQGWIHKDDMVPLVQHFQSEMAAMRQEHNRLVQAAELMYGQQRQIQPHLSTLMSSAQQQQLDSVIGRLQKTYDITEPEDQAAMREVCMNIVDSYEPNTFSFEHHLPDLFAQQWQQLEKTFHRRSVAAAKQNRGLPGKGGQATPSLPLTDDGVSERELAKRAWDAIQSAPAT
jgi:hypothetical protein